MCLCAGWRDWHGWSVADSSGMKCAAVWCCSRALPRLTCRMHMQMWCRRGNSPHSKHVLLSLRMDFFLPLGACGWMPASRIFTTQRQFLWTSFSRCCQLFTFLSFYSLCLHGSLHVCGACRREGQSGRRRPRKGSSSQLCDMGNLQSSTPWSPHVAVTLCPCKKQHKLSSIKPALFFS